MDLLCFCSVLCWLCLCARLFICALWSPAGKGLTSWLSFVVSTVSLSLSHWYPGSGVVLDCIDSLSLHPYLLCIILITGVLIPCLQLVDTNAYKLQPCLNDKVVVNGYGCHTVLHFGVNANENQDRVPTLYWLPKLHKKTYKA